MKAHRLLFEKLILPAYTNEGVYYTMILEHNWCPVEPSLLQRII